MYQNLGIHWASSIPAFLALMCAPFPFLFYKYGKEIRLKCKFAAEAAAALERIRTVDHANENEEGEEVLEEEEREEAEKEEEKNEESRRRNEKLESEGSKEE